MLAKKQPTRKVSNMKTVEETKEEIAENINLDEVLPIMEAVTQLIEENGPIYLDCVERVSDLIIPVFMKAMSKGAVEGGKMRGEAILESYKVLAGFGKFTHTQIIELLVAR